MRAFDVRHGGQASDGRWLAEFFIVRLGPVTLTVLRKWVRWPAWARWQVLKGCTIARFGAFVLSVRR